MGHEEPEKQHARQHHRRRQALDEAHRHDEDEERGEGEEAEPDAVSVSDRTGEPGDGAEEDDGVQRRPQLVVAPGEGPSVGGEEVRHAPGELATHVQIRRQLERRGLRARG